MIVCQGHQHAPEATTKHVYKAKDAIKDLARNSMALTSQEITNHVVGELPTEVVSHMPLVRSQQRLIRSIRIGTNRSANFHSISDDQF